MTRSLKFSHKILLAASLVVIAAFALFTLYNDYLQRNAIRHQLKGSIADMGQGAAGNIQSGLSGRILLVENLAESLAAAPTAEGQDVALKQKTLLATFMSVYIGKGDGAFAEFAGIGVAHLDAPIIDHVADAGLVGVEPGQEGGPRGTAARGVVKLRESHPVPRQGV